MVVVPTTVIEFANACAVARGRFGLVEITRLPPTFENEVNPVKLVS